jgi:hypothetical protein
MFHSLIVFNPSPIHNLLFVEACIVIPVGVAKSFGTDIVTVVFELISYTSIEPTTSISLDHTQGDALGKSNVVLVVVVDEVLLVDVVLVELELVLVVVGGAVVLVVDVLVELVLVVVDVLELVDVVVVGIIVVLVVVVLVEGVVDVVVVVVGFCTIVISQGSSKQRSGSLHLLTHPAVSLITLLAIICTEYFDT